MSFVDFVERNLRVLNELSDMDVAAYPKHWYVVPVVYDEFTLWHYVGALPPANVPSADRR